MGWLVFVTAGYFGGGGSTLLGKAMQVSGALFRYLQ